MRQPPLLTLLMALTGCLAARRAWARLYTLGTRRYPPFVFADVAESALGVPVFTYHSIAGPETPDSVTPHAFERHLRYLVDNDYTTLSADELVAHLVDGRAVPPRAVVLCFDDGRASVWTAAFPLLRRYGLRAVCFLVPGLMAESGVRPQSPGAPEHAGNGARARSVDLGPQPYLTWDEVRAMHASGLIDFQSHTLYHTLIPCRRAIVDFFHPGLDGGFANIRFPVQRVDGVDRWHARAAPGTPIYASQPRMSAARRYFDDEGLRAACVEYVTRRGAPFFAEDGWRAELHRVAADYRRRHALRDACESADEQCTAIRHSLIHSQQMIADYLPGHRVRHLCFPWHRASALAVCLARDSGYVACFGDINPQKPLPRWNDPYLVQHLLPPNEPGDDPYQITRIDARDDMVLSLPGAGRLTYAERILARLLAREPGG